MNVGLFAWAKKAVTIEMNHVIWFVGNPNFRFPSNVRGKFSESVSVEEGGHENQWQCASATQLLEGDKSFWGNGSEAVDGLHKEDPPPLLVPQHDVW